MPHRSSRHPHSSPRRPGRIARPASAARDATPRPVPLAVALMLSALCLPAISQVAVPPAPPATASPAAEPTPSGERTATREQTAAPETIIITGSRRPQTAASAPYNITAIPEQALREQNITDVKQLITQSIGLNAPGNSARFADSVTVRGLSIAPVNANNIEQFARSTLSYYLDDTPLPNIGYRIKDVARVETLLGPQGTLYGAGALGGTVRFITNRPVLGKVEGRLNTSFYQTRNGGLSNDTDAVVNLPLGDTFALRAVLSRLDEKGYTDRISNPPWRTGADAWVTQPDPDRNVYEDDDYQRVNGGRVSLLWQPLRGVQVLLAHAQQNQLAHGTTGVNLLPLGVANARNPAEVEDAWRNPGRELADFPCFPNCAYTSRLRTPVAVNDHTVLSRYPEFADRRFKLDSIDVDIDLGFADLHSSTSHFSDNRTGQGDYANQGWAYYYSLGDLGGAIDSGRSAYVGFDNRYKGTSNETRLTSKPGGALTWVGGLYVTRQTKSLKFDEVLPGMDAFLGSDKARPSPKPDVGYGEDLSSRYKETALFGEATWRVMAPWTVTVGARVFNYDDTANVSIIDYAGGFVDNQYTAGGGENGKSFYKFNTAYQLSDNMLVYGTVSQGFRRGGTNPFKDQGSQIVAAAARSYEPDSTTNYELGVKGYALDRRLYVAADIYRIDWKDAQTYREQTVDGFPVNGTANGPNARTTGLEVSLRLRVTPQWQLTYEGATTDAKWVTTKTQCIYEDGTGCRTWEAGGKLGGSPKWKHKAGVRWQGDLTASLYGWATFDARYTGGVRSDRSDSSADNDSVFIYPSYTVLNAAVGFGQGPWEAQVWVQNLADKRALVSNQAAGLMGDRLIFSQPRTVGLNVSYSF